MATIVNTPAQGHVHEDAPSNAGTNLLVGALIIITLALLFYYFALPLFRSVGGSAPQINNYAPPQGNAQPQLNVPDKVNVDVNTPGAGQ